MVCHLLPFAKEGQISAQSLQTSKGAGQEAQLVLILITDDRWIRRVPIRPPSSALQTQQGGIWPSEGTPLVSPSPAWLGLAAVC